MIERTPNTQKYLENLPEVASVYKDAFAGHPWYENLSFEEAYSRVQTQAQKSGFEAFVAEGTNGEVVGALWYDTPTPERLAEERGQPLVDFAKELCAQYNIPTVVWEREVLVHPNSQGQKIATRLRTTFLSHLTEEFPKGALVLTRMRDDNTGIIKIAENVGFQRTGIRIASSQNPNISHEYWYRLVTPSSTP